MEKLSDGRAISFDGESFKKAFDLVLIGDRRMTQADFEALPQADKEALLDAIEHYRAHSVPKPVDRGGRGTA